MNAHNNLFSRPPSPLQTNAKKQRTAMFSAGRAVSLTWCGRDWGMGKRQSWQLADSSGHSYYWGQLASSLSPLSYEVALSTQLCGLVRSLPWDNLFTVLVYSGRYVGRRPPKVGPCKASLTRPPMVSKCAVRIDFCFQSRA